MREIPLTQGFKALVDDADYERASRLKWRVIRRASGLYYAQATEFYRREDAAWVGMRSRKGIKQAPLSRRTVLMHRYILGLTKRSPTVRHGNGDGLDNRRSNLKPEDPRIEAAKRGKRYAISRSGFFGVGFRPDLRSKPWLAQITINGRRRYLGYYEAEREAALAYDDAAREYLGNGARLNFPLEAG